ncbi:methyltransferase domain-containing protein [Ewingella allii]|uniref:class I SAM-dependent methyltransferase n=1 Tax=Ewingella allii TaxID=3092550 RepID=UPI0037994B57
MDHPSADKIIDLYQRNSDYWDDIRGKQLFELPWLEHFLNLQSAVADILDIGCGSGKPIANYFVEQGHRVTGVDSSAAMIALCRQRFPAHHWQVADMRQLALGQKFDGILAWDSFFHLKRDDQRGMFALFEQHAKPNAALMFTSGPANGEAIGEFNGETLYHASLAPEEYRQLLADHGFSLVKNVVEDPECGGHTIWLAQAGES